MWWYIVITTRNHDICHCERPSIYYWKCHCQTFVVNIDTMPRHFYCIYLCSSHWMKILFDDIYSRHFNFRFKNFMPTGVYSSTYFFTATPFPFRKNTDMASILPFGYGLREGREHITLTWYACRRSQSITNPFYGI